MNIIIPVLIMNIIMEVLLMDIIMVVVVYLLNNYNNLYKIPTNTIITKTRWV